MIDNKTVFQQSNPMKKEKSNKRIVDEAFYNSLYLLAKERCSLPDDKAQYLARLFSTFTVQDE